VAFAYYLKTILRALWGSISIIGSKTSFSPSDEAVVGPGNEYFSQQNLIGPSKNAAIKKIVLYNCIRIVVIQFCVNNYGFVFRAGEREGGVSRSLPRASHIDSIDKGLAIAPYCRMVYDILPRASQIVTLAPIVFHYQLRIGTWCRCVSVQNNMSF